jgi:hypothetical protein
MSVGGYNYVYALTSVKFLDYILGISLGSIKPYFLDSYLGSCIRDALAVFLPNSATNNPMATATIATNSLAIDEALGSQWIPLLVLVSIIVVSSFATDLFSATYDEIDKELKLIIASKKKLDEIPNDTEEDVDMFIALGIEEESLPALVRNTKKLTDDAWQRIQMVVLDEVRD